MILTVSAKDCHRIDPVLAFKDNGRLAHTEQQKYAKGVNIIFTLKPVLNKQFMDVYVQYWLGKVKKYYSSKTVSLFIQHVLLCLQIKDDKHKLLITDSANSHLNLDTIHRLKRCSVVVAIIPKGMTMHLQVLDVSVLNVFKKGYYDAAEEWLDVHGSRSKVNLISSQSRILCTRLTKSAWCRTLNSIDFETTFREFSYTWREDSPIYSCTLAGFCFDPSSMNFASDYSSDDVDVEKIERDAEAANKESDALVNWENQGKQPKWGEYRKRWFHIFLFDYFYLLEIVKTIPIGWC